MTSTDVLVLGGGLAGLSVAANLGTRAIVLEGSDRPGGLVRTHNIGQWWFDHVIHLLYFRDEITRVRVSGLLGRVLTPCVPDAWVDTHAGVARFPIQEHLGHLQRDACVACIVGAAREVHATYAEPPANYRDVLLRSFGSELCELFFFPYNTKLWRRDLASLAPAGFVWNLARPDLVGLIRGALDPDAGPRAYNADGWYPRPPAGSTLRGMEVLTQAVATEVADIRLRHEVVAVHPKDRSVTVRTPDGNTAYSWRNSCVATLPLPVLVARCDDVPREVSNAARTLAHVRVFSVAVRVRGRRPHMGHWKYYASPDVVFTRLVFLHEFDPLMAPPEGWPLLAEVPWRTDEAMPDDLGERVVSDARRVGAIGPADEVLDTTVLTADPAYVVFNRDGEAAVAAIAAWLRATGINPVGRYGRWEYSSMAQVLRDGYALGSELAASLVRV